MAATQTQDIGRLSVAMFNDQKTGKPKCLRTSTDDGVSVWSECRIIDGTLYALDSTHATMEAALQRQDKLREETSAQAYQSANAKFTEVKDGLFKPAIAAVYKLPYRGAKGLIVAGKPHWPEEPSEPAVRGKPFGRKKTARRNVVVSKSGARIVAKPKKVDA